LAEITRLAKIEANQGNELQLEGMAKDRINRDRREESGLHEPERDTTRQSVILLSKYS